MGRYRSWVSWAVLGWVALLVSSAGVVVPGTGVAALGAAFGTPVGTAPISGVAPAANFTAITVTPGSELVGSPVTVAGSGFAPGALNLTFGVSPVGCSVSGGLFANASGNFSCGFDVPAVTAGPYLLNASQPNASATTSLTVLPPTLFATPTHASVGASVSLTGAGYAPNATLRIALGPAPVTGCPGGGSLTASSAGGLLCTFSVPGLPAGSYSLTVNDSVNPATISFTVDPATLLVSPAAGPVGSLAVAAGAGFTPGATVSLTMGTQGLGCRSGSLAVNASGGFRCGFAVPALAAGGYTVAASDSVNLASASFTVNAPTLTVTPGSGLVGSTAEASGTGYVPNAALTLTLGGSAVMCGAAPPRANASGDLACGFTVPAVTLGTRALAANDSVNRAQTSFRVDQPTLALSPNTGRVGSRVNASGGGYAPYGSVTVTFASSPVSCSGGSTSINRTGYFRCAFDVPTSLRAGVWAVTATDGTNVGWANYTVGSTTLALNRSSGPIGSALGLSGVGYTPSTSLTIQFGGKSQNCTAGSDRTDSSGVLACTIKIPADLGGTYEVSASDGTHTGNATFTIIPSIQLTPDHGVSGTDLTINGTGFVANAGEIPIWWYTSNSSSARVLLCPAYLDLGGQFTCGGGTTSPTPAEATWGPHLIVATNGLIGPILAEANFTVDPFVTATPGSARGGSPGPVQFLGTGFNASTGFQLYLGGSAVACGNRTTNLNGSFACPYNVSTDQPGGAFVLRATQGGLESSAVFTILPTLNDSPLAGVPGTVVSLTGYNFGASTGYSYCLQPTSEACPAGAPSFQTDAAGTVPTGVSLTVPGGLNLTEYWFDASNGSVVVGARFYVTSATLSAIPGSGTVGASLTLSGSGFGPNTQYFYCVLPQPAACPVGTTTQFRTNGTGGVPTDAAFVIPYLPRGVSSIDVSRGTVLVASAAFTVRDNLTASTGRGSAGALVFVNGTGFDADQPVTVSFSGAPSASCEGGPLVTNATGSFECIWTVPAIPGGLYQLSFTEGSNSLGRAFGVVPALVLAPPSGPAGHPVMVEGTGFDASAPFSLRWSGASLSCFLGAEETNASGSFSCTFAVPASTGPGAHAVEVIEGAYDLKTSFEVTVQPALSVVEVAGGLRGPVGSAVKATGSGFAPGADVTLTFAGSVPVPSCIAPSPYATPTTNSTGVLTCYFDLPAAGAGPRPISASQNVSGTWVWANATFTVVPSLDLHPVSGPVGTNVTLTGTGFFASGHTAGFTVVWAGVTTVCSGTTGPTGNLSCAFDVPAGRAGTYELLANDSHEPAVAANFTVVAVSHGIPRWAIDAGLLAGGGALILLIAVLVWRSRRAARAASAARVDGSPAPDGGPPGTTTTGGSTDSPAPPGSLTSERLAPPGTPEGLEAASYDELVARVTQLRQQLAELQAEKVAAPPAPASGPTPDANRRSGSPNPGAPRRRKKRRNRG